MGNFCYIREKPLQSSLQPSATSKSGLSAESPFLLQNHYNNGEENRKVLKPDIQKMPIAKLTIELEIPHAQSLKDRRQVVRSIKDKLRHSFNLSIAELDDGIVWNRATLGIAAISSSTSYLTGQIQIIDDAIHRLAAGLSAEITDSYAEILPE
jgi:uncharacterized protein YlxP (DUF503 family)